MTIEYSVIFAYLIGIIFLYFLGRLLLVPMKIILKAVYSAIIGGLLLIVINFIGGAFGFHIALNIITALTAGILGIPGVALLAAMKYMFNV